jgi:hypothetical protein
MCLAPATATAVAAAWQATSKCQHADPRQLDNKSKVIVSSNLFEHSITTVAAFDLVQQQHYTC